MRLGDRRYPKVLRCLILAGSVLDAEDLKHPQIQGIMQELFEHRKEVRGIFQLTTDFSAFTIDKICNFFLPGPSGKQDMEQYPMYYREVTLFFIFLENQTK